MPEDPLEEELCRACCAIDGLNPDQMVGVDGRAGWKTYLPFIRKFRAMDAVMRAHEGKIVRVAQEMLKVAE